MASKKSSKKASKKKPTKPALSSSALFAKDLKNLFSKYGVQPLTISSELSLDCPPGTHPEMVPIQQPNGDTILVRICVKDD